jgi:aminoglycoside phosphotransferase (APT) family kinase protein
VDDVRVRELVGRRLPACRVERVELIGAGIDNTAYVVNGDIVVRFAKDVAAAQVEREGRLLGVVARMSPLAVPEPLFVEADEGCLAYRMVRGIPLIERDAPYDGLLAAEQLGAFLAALHSAPTEAFDGLAAPDVVPLSDWLEEAAETFEAVRDQVPDSRRPAISRFLAAETPAGPDSLVFSHNDLGIEHVMVDPASGAVTGVIDWTDAALVDRANDFGRIYRDLGPDALAAALAQYGSAATDQLVDRAMFYARCGVFEDLAFGLETGRTRYTDKCLRALHWLFP